MQAFRPFSLLAVACCIWLNACGGPPDVYAPPIERKPMDVYGADLVGPFASLGSPDAAVNLVGGIDRVVMSGAWRWAFPHAELRFYLPAQKQWDAELDFAIAKDILDKTGPQSLTIFVNNSQVDQLHYSKDGNYTWRKFVPESLLAGGGMNYVRIEADKFATDPAGRQLGFILTRAGFVPAKSPR